MPNGALGSTFACNAAEILLQCHRLRVLVLTMRRHTMQSAPRNEVACAERRKRAVSSVG